MWLLRLEWIVDVRSQIVAINYMEAGGSLNNISPLSQIRGFVSNYQYPATLGLEALHNGSK